MSFGKNQHKILPNIMHRPVSFVLPNSDQNSNGVHPAFDRGTIEEPIP